MKFPLLVSVFLLMARASTVDITVRGIEGGEAIITCPYPAGYKQSQKYFYKGPYRDNNLIFKSDGRQSSLLEDRFSLKDDHQTSFTVTIRDLQMTDTGPYSCAAGWGYSKSIQLNVFRAPQKPKPVQISTSTILPNTKTSTETHQTANVTTTTRTGNTTVQHTQTTPMSHTDPVYVVGGLGLVLLVLVLCSGILLKKRKKKHETALSLQNPQQNTEIDCMYEEVVNRGVIAAEAPSSNQTPATDINTHPEVVVYATVVKRHPDSIRGNTPLTNQETDTYCDYYGNIKSPKATQVPQEASTNEGPIYSVIKHK